MEKVIKVDKYLFNIFLKDSQRIREWISNSEVLSRDTSEVINKGDSDSHLRSYGHDSVDHFIDPKIGFDENPCFLPGFLLSDFGECHPYALHLIVLGT